MVGFRASLCNFLLAFLLGAEIAGTGKTSKHVCSHASISKGQILLIKKKKRKPKATGNTTEVQIPVLICISLSGVVNFQCCVKMLRISMLA